jgi:predicted Fe-S protein YdhL (DUF1289 family)
MSAVPSPCISVCRLDAASRRCEGCFRTTGEIEAWMVLDDRERIAIWQRLAQQQGVSIEAALARRVGPVSARELVRLHGSR